MGKIDRFQVVDFSLLLPRTCCWNFSVIENYKFDLWFFHRAEFRPLTEAIKCPPNCEHLTTYIIYLLHTVVFTILEQGLMRAKTTFVYTELQYHCRLQTTIHIVSASCVHNKNQCTKSCLTLKSKR